MRFYEFKQNIKTPLTEGARIDHAGHLNDINKVIHETIEFDKAVDSVLQWAGGKEDGRL